MGVFRLDLAHLVDPTDDTAHGLGTVIVSDILNVLGVPDQDPPLSFSSVLNAPGALSFWLPIEQGLIDTAPDGDLGARELHLYEDGDLVWGGRLWDLAVPQSSEPLDAIQFIAQGWYSTLRKRENTVDHSYLPAMGVSADQVNIAWDLISWTQGRAGGNLGITRTGTDASNASGKKRSADYCSWDRRKIADIIEELASADDGFDFDIGPGKRWRTWSPRRGARQATTLDAALNISELGLGATTLDHTISQFAALGPCSHCVGDTDVEEFTNAAALDRYGLLQDSAQFDVKDNDHLKALGREQLRLRKLAVATPVVVLDYGSDAGLPSTPAWGSYDVGDSFPLNVAELGLAAKPFRLTQKQTDVHLGGDKLVSLSFDPAVA